MKVAIIQFGGTNCDLDVLHVLKDVVGVDAETVWYKQEKLIGFDGVIIPGGFSYGDYLRAGAIAARTPIMDSVKTAGPERTSFIGDRQPRSRYRHGGRRTRATVYDPTRRSRPQRDVRTEARTHRRQGRAIRYYCCRQPGAFRTYPHRPPCGPQRR